MLAAMKRRRVVILLLLVAIAPIVLLDQALSLLAIDDGWLGDRRVAPYDPPIFSRAQEASVARLASGEAGFGAVRYDAELGWASPRREHAGDSYYDEFGARRAAPREGEVAAPRRVMMIGCSFTHGDEIAPQHAIASRLEATTSAAVFNCGFGAYGLDQALLVLRREGRRIAPTDVWLGVLPKALPRLLGVYRPALRRHDLSVSFKPRFRLAAGGELELVPNPAPSPADAVRLLRTRGAFFVATHHVDSIVAEDVEAFAPLGSRLWHRSGLARLAFTALESRSRPTLEERLAAGGELFALSLAVVAATRREAEALGARLLVIVMPDGDDVAAALRGESSVLDPWLRALAQREGSSVGILDPTAALVAAGVRPGAPWFEPGGHHSPRTAEALAAILASHSISR
jgi:hypothetical protein